MSESGLRCEKDRIVIHFSTILDWRMPVCFRQRMRTIDQVLSLTGEPDIRPTTDRRMAYPTGGITWD